MGAVQLGRWQRSSVWQGGGRGKAQRARGTHPVDSVGITGGATACSASIYVSTSATLSPPRWMPERSRGSCRSAPKADVSRRLALPCVTLCEVPCATVDANTSSKTLLIADRDMPIDARFGIVG